MESHLRNMSRFFLLTSVISFKNVLHLFPYMPLCVCADVCTVVFVWRSEDNCAVGAVPSLRLDMGSGDQTQVSRLAGQCLHLLSRPASPMSTIP